MVRLLVGDDEPDKERFSFGKPSVVRSSTKKSAGLNFFFQKEKEVTSSTTLFEYCCKRALLLYQKFSSASIVFRICQYTFFVLLLTYESIS